jgi:hypothetical protein
MEHARHYSGREKARQVFPPRLGENVYQAGSRSRKQRQRFSTVRRARCRHRDPGGPRPGSGKAIPIHLGRNVVVAAR